MEFVLRVPCLEGFSDTTCQNCHICLNSAKNPETTSTSKQPQMGSNNTSNIKENITLTSSSKARISSANLTLKRLCTLLLIVNLFSSAAGCGPGRGIGGPRPKRKLTPLVFKQHVPNMSEQSLGASGISEGAIKSNSAKFKKLEFNNNQDIIFKDEEGTGADHVMTRVSFLEFLSSYLILKFNG